MKYRLLLIMSVYFISCERTHNVNLKDVALPDMSGNMVNVAKLADNGTAVFIFISPECPLCINYTKTINDLHVKFLTDSIVFIPVYPGSLISMKEINEFSDEYDFKLSGLMDPDLRLTELLHATVTPEAVVVTKSGDIVYSGAIDNWMYETGKKRTVITKNFLEDALSALLKGEKPEPGKTEAVGCFIEL